MNLPNKIEIANLPTEIKEIKRFTEYMNLPVKLYIKRDDETGLYVTGNKIRKLEYIAAYALENDYDTLVTCGGIQSNHARTTAYIATLLGINSYLVLKGKEPPTYDGNYLLDRLFGAEVEWVSEDEYANNIEEIFAKVEKKLRNQERKPLVIPEGASYSLGMFGYIEATKELKEQFFKMGIRMDYVVSSVGSGGTLAGFLMGQKLFDLNTEMYGINICDDAKFFKGKIFDMLNEFKSIYPGYIDNLSFSRDEINIIDGYVGEGYGIPYHEEIDIIKVLAKTEGIILDPTYTGKAFYGLLDQIKRGTFEEGSNILFVHTGGIYGIFPQKEKFNF